LYKILIKGVVAGRIGDDDKANNENEKEKEIHSSPISQDRSTQFLANERTFLAWLRTSIAIIGLGFVVARFSLFLREFGFVISQGPGNTNSSIEQGSHAAMTSIQDLLASGTHSPSSLLGLSIVGLGIILIVYALFNYKRAHRIMEQGGEYVSKHSIIYVASLGLIAFGIIVIVYLILVSV
jgi:putative membrane protein